MSAPRKDKPSAERTKNAGLAIDLADSGDETVAREILLRIDRGIGELEARADRLLHALGH